MMTTSAGIVTPFHAITDDQSPTVVQQHDGDNNSEKRQEQQGQQQQRRTVDESLLRKIRSSSLYLGLFVGYLIQLGSLGASFLVMAMWGDENQGMFFETERGTMAFSVMWSVSTSILAVISLGLLRIIVSSAVKGASVTSAAATAATTVDDDDDDDDGFSFLDELLLNVEYRFVVGALIGDCLAWLINDALLGFRVEMVFSIVALLLALLWCRLILYCYSKNRNDKNKTSSNSSSNNGGDNRKVDLSVV